MYKKHRRGVIITHVCCSPITIPLLLVSPVVFLPISLVSDVPNLFSLYGCHGHYPTIYGNKYEQRNSGKVKIKDDYKE